MDSLVGWNDELALAVEKPDAGEQVTVTPVEGQGLDLSAIAALNAQFYRSGSDLWLVFEDGAIVVVEGYFEGTTETADGTPRSVIVDGETFTGEAFMTAFAIDDLPEEFAEGETGDAGPQQNGTSFDDPSLGDLGPNGQGIGLLGNSNRFGTGDTGTGGGGDRQDTDPTIGVTDPGAVDEDGIVTDGESVFVGSLAVNFGNNDDDTPDSADLQDTPTGFGDRSITFDAAAVGSAVPLTSGGTPLTFALSNGGTVLTASANGVPVFEVRLFDDGEGSYRFTLLGPLDHPDPLSEDDVELTFSFTATDDDGDSASGIFTVTVNDDVPEVGENARIIIDDGDVSTDGNPGIRNNPMDGAGTDDVPANTTGTLDLSFGADGGSVVWVPEDVTTSGGADGLRFTTGEDGSLLILQNQNGEEVTVATITLNRETGEYTVTQNNPLIHRDDPANRENDQDFVLAYRVTDGDGDTAEGTIRLTIDDDTPVARGSGTVEVFEDGTADGVFVEQSADGTLLFNGGADGAAVSNITYRFGGAALDQDDGEFVALTSGNEPVDVATSEDGLRVTGRVGEQVIFTLEVTDPSTGAFTFTQFAPIDHPDEGESGTQDHLRLVFDFTVTDGDGDTSTSWVQVDINDDAPETTGAQSFTVDEDRLPEGTDTNPNRTVGTRDLGIAWGADDDTVDSGTDTVGRRLAFVGEDGSAITAPASDVALETTASYRGVELTEALTSDGVLILLDVQEGPNGGQILIGYKEGGDPANPDDQVIRITLDPTSDTGSYTVELLGNIDHPDEDGVTSEFEPVVFDISFAATDSDGDEVQDSFTVRIQDDQPEGENPQNVSFDEDRVSPDGNDFDPDQSPNRTEKTRSLRIDWGADNDTVSAPDDTVGRTLAFVDGAGEPVAAGTYTQSDLDLRVVFTDGGTAPSELSSNGIPLQFVIETTDTGGQILTAYRGDPDNGERVFVVELDPTTDSGSYTVTLLDNIDHADPNSGSNRNSVEIEVGFQAFDADGDALKGTVDDPNDFKITIFDDEPVVSPVEAEAVGEEFFVNGVPDDLEQQNADVTPLAGDGFIVTWQSGTSSADFDIRARIFDTDGNEVVPDFLVNQLTARGQQNPSVTGLPNGGFVITWESADRGQGDTSGTAIKARVFEADGTPAGDEFRVNTTTQDPQADADVTVLADGGFIITWQDVGLFSGRDNTIRARLFDADGTPAGDDFVINGADVGGDGGFPSVSALSDGGFVVTWQAEDADGGTVVLASVFNANGIKVVSDFLVNDITTGGEGLPDITALEGGGFVVTWESGGFFTSSAKARVFDASGQEIVSEFLVSENSEESQTSPVVTALADGGFVITWQSGDPFSGFDVKARVFNAAGEEVVSEFLVSESVEGSQTYPVVTALPDGGFVVTWQTIDGFFDDADVKARIFRFADTLSVDEADITDGSPTSVSGTLGVDFGADGFGSSVFTGAFSVAGGETLHADGEGVDSGLTSDGEPVLFRLLDGGKRIQGYTESSGDLIVEIALDPNGAAWILTLHGAVDHGPGFTGQGASLPLSFTVAATDGDGDAVEVVLKAAVIDDDPATGGDQVTTNEDTSVVINVLTNDQAGADGTDPTDGGITTASAPLHGSVQINDDGTITYTPDENYSGDDSFTYTITDGDGDTSTATVNVTVDPVPDPPAIGGEDSGLVTEDSPRDLEGSDLVTRGKLDIDDPDPGESAFMPETLTTLADGEAARGSLTIDEEGNWAYSISNDLKDVQNLHAGESFTETFRVSSVDGTTKDISIVVDGVDEVRRETVADVFPFLSYGENAGSQNWSDRWRETGDDGSPSNGGGGDDIYLNFFGNNGFLELTDRQNGLVGDQGDGEDATVFRTVDLSQAVSATLSFKFRGSLNDASDIVRVQVSANGSDFVTLRDFNSGNTNSDFRTFRFDISDYMTADTTIRFVATSGLESEDFGHVDDVTVSYLVPTPPPDPLILDLNDDGTGTVSAASGVMFDMDGDGTPESVGWATPDDGLLAVDLDGSGAIENGRELFSEVFEDGTHANSLEALRTLDSNGDGIIDASDERFADIKVWKDADSDGVTDDGELLSLADHGIASIDLDANEVNRDEEGNLIFAEGEFTRTDGETGSYIGVAFDTGDDNEVVFGEAASKPLRGTDSADDFILADLAERQVILDFNTSEDRLDLTALLDGVATVQATSDGTNTVITVDADGAGDQVQSQDVAVLVGVTAGAQVTVVDNSDTTAVEITITAMG